MGFTWDHSPGISSLGTQPGLFWCCAPCRNCGGCWSSVTRFSIPCQAANGAYASNSFLSSTLAFLPTGLMLTIPLRNSTKVPRFFGSLRSAIYFRQKSTKFWYFSSPSHWIKLLLARGFPRRYAVKPFSAKQKSNSVVTGIEDVPNCSCCLPRSEPPTWTASEMEELSR